MLLVGVVVKKRNVEGRRFRKGGCKHEGLARRRFPRMQGLDAGSWTGFRATKLAVGTMCKGLSN